MEHLSFTLRWTEYSDESRVEIIAKYEQTFTGFATLGEALAAWADFWNPTDFHYSTCEVV